MTVDLFSNDPECVANFFLVGGRCNSCPGNSTSSGGSADRCTCDMNYTTMDGSTTTNGEGCVCGVNYHVDSSTGQCVSCPANSVRAITDVDSVCSCNTNYRTASGDMTTSGSVGCTGKPSKYLTLVKMAILLCDYMWGEGGGCRMAGWP